MLRSPFDPEPNRRQCLARGLALALPATLWDAAQAAPASAPSGGVLKNSASAPVGSGVSAPVSVASASAAKPAAPPASQAASRPSADTVCPVEWPLWTQFRSQLVAPDGRVIDADTPRAHTVSEAQAYALFFALVANDRTGFAKLLEWTQNNLAAGDLTSRLPAWQWGRRDDGQWAVVDANSASDADLWLIYALAEAARLWQLPGYAVIAQSLSQRLLQEAVVDLPGLGPTLLPAPKGFALGALRWRLNPSYLPPHLMRYMARYLSNARAPKSWVPVLTSSQAMVVGAAAKGFSPDWILYSPKGGFEVDTTGPDQGRGGYNAIRTYLWAGLTHPGDAHRARLLKAHLPMAKLVAQLGYVPEYVDVSSGLGAKPGPSGFAAAMLPFLQATQQTDAFNAQQARLTAQPVRQKTYYEQALLLFAQGALQRRYRFAADGRLQVPWALKPARACW